MLDSGSDACIIMTGIPMCFYKHGYLFYSLITVILLIYRTHAIKPDFMLSVDSIIWNRVIALGHYVSCLVARACQRDRNALQLLTDRPTNQAGPG